MSHLAAALYQTLIAVLVHVAIIAGGVCLAIFLWALYANHRCRIEEEKAAEHFARTDSIRADLEAAERKPYRVIGGKRGPDRSTDRETV